MRTIVNENQNAGDYSYKIPALAEDGSILPQGTYTYRLRAGEVARSGSIILAR